MTNTDHSTAVSGAEDRVVVERYRHLKRGTVYEVVGTAELQAEQLQGDHAALTIYRGENSKLWARNTAEFHDGRFERLAAPAQTPERADPVREADMEKAFLRGYEEARLDWPNDEREVSARLYVAGMRVALAATTSVPAISKSQEDSLIEVLKRIDDGKYPSLQDRVDAILASTSVPAISDNKLKAQAALNHAAARILPGCVDDGMYRTASGKWAKVREDDLRNLAAAYETFYHLKSMPLVTTPTISGEGEKLREAAEKARAQFQFYADEHGKAGKYEKARTNAGFAEMLEASLATPAAAESERAGAGWIVGSADRNRWRTWADGECRWGDDREQATRYARRADAEAVHAEDDDAWIVEFYDPASAWLPITDDAKSGKLVELVVDYSEGDHPLQDGILACTVGFNTLADTGVDEWKFAGWCWTHDHFVQGKGAPVAWRPSRLGACDDGLPALPDAAPIGSDDAGDRSADVGKMIPKGMKPWGGDERAPDDWDGGRVLGDDGEFYEPYEDGGLDWQHGLSSRDIGADIIAYTPAALSPAGSKEEAK